MHPSILLLKKVVKMAQEEFNLLELEDAAGLSESADQRAALLKQAWEEKNGCNEMDFVSLLTVIKDLQRKLGSAASEKFEETRDALNSQKKSRNAVLGYAMTGVSYGKRPPRIVTKMS